MFYGVILDVDVFSLKSYSTFRKQPTTQNLYRELSVNHLHVAYLVVRELQL